MTDEDTPPARRASVTRNTAETQITLSINLDGDGTSHFQTGLPFFDHMLTQIARHGLIDIDVSATGDLEVDAHHMVEDVGIVLGQALAKAVGDKSGLTRYGHAYVPLDEALSRAKADVSARLEAERPEDRAALRLGRVVLAAHLDQRARLSLLVTVQRRLVERRGRQVMMGKDVLGDQVAQGRQVKEG